MGGTGSAFRYRQVVCAETCSHHSIVQNKLTNPCKPYIRHTRVLSTRRSSVLEQHQSPNVCVRRSQSNSDSATTSTTGRQIEDDFTVISSDGKWRVRKIRKDDLKEIQRVVFLQAEGFHTGHPIPLLDGFLKTSFKAEVVSEMQKKLKYNPEDKFVSLIVEPHEDSNDSDVLGVVEVSYIDEKEVLSSLEPGTQGVVYIASMTVAEQVRRMGAAKALLEGAIQVTKAWNEDMCVLHVYQDNTPAIQLYHDFGFETIFGDAAWWAKLAVRPRFLMRKNV